MLRDRELGLLYEVTFLNLVITFEAFQEELFFSALLGAADIVAVRPLISFRHRAEAERIVLATERSPFLTWSKTKDSIERARRFLFSGRPFSRLERRDRDSRILSDVFTVRNAIAHQSGAARQAFARLPGSGLPVGSRRKPAHYLRQVVGADTQHEVLCREVLRISKALISSDDASARTYLLPERPYRTGDEVGRGTFVCTTCQHRLRVAARRALPTCPACNSGPCSMCGSTQRSEFVRL